MKVHLGVFLHYLQKIQYVGGGVVFGARFNELWEVVHDYTETIGGLIVFRGSKYVQSSIGETYKQAKSFHDSGRQVMFSGTPCQIAGLKAFMRKDYNNLLTVDFVCHGVPSPKVWEKYLSEFIDTTMQKDIAITEIKFRNKRNGWKRCLFSVDGSHDTEKYLFVENSNENVFMKGFLQSLYLRLSCYHCPARSLKSGSDITIADYWGIENVLPEFDDDKGVSLVMVNTEKGRQVYHALSKDDRETSYAEALAGNQCIEKSVLLPAKRVVFFKKWLDEPVIPLIDRLTRMPFIFHIKKVLVYLLRKPGLLGIVKSIIRRS